MNIVSFERVASAEEDRLLEAALRKLVSTISIHSRTPIVRSRQSCLVQTGCTTATIPLILWTDVHYSLRLFGDVGFRFKIESHYETAQQGQMPNPVVRGDRLILAFSYSIQLLFEWY